MPHTAQRDLEGPPIACIPPCGQFSFSRTPFISLPGVCSKTDPTGCGPLTVLEGTSKLAQAQRFLLERCEWQWTQSCLLCRGWTWELFHSVPLAPAPNLCLALVYPVLRDVAPTPIQSAAPADIHPGEEFQIPFLQALLVLAKASLSMDMTFQVNLGAWTRVLRHMISFLKP